MRLPGTNCRSGGSLLSLGRELAARGQFGLFARRTAQLAADARIGLRKNVRSSSEKNVSQNEEGEVPCLCGLDDVAMPSIDHDIDCRISPEGLRALLTHNLVQTRNDVAHE